MTEDRARMLLEARASPFPLDDAPCPYLEGRTMRLECWYFPFADAADHRVLLDRNFRRAPGVFYRPRCPGCDACRQLRVLVFRFRPSRSQRRCLRRNRDLVQVRVDADADDEKLDLYRRYMRARHPGSPQGTNRVSLRRLVEDFVPSEAFLFEYRDASGRLLAVSAVERVEGGLSSKYCFFDPDERRRSLGTFTALAEIAWCRARGLPYYYLGYWVAGAPKMAYKADFRPHERFDPRRGFVVVEGRGQGSGG